MIKTLLLLLLTGIGYIHGYAQDQPDVIVGKWMKLPKKDLIIEVYKTAATYHGKICWTKPGDDKPVGFVIIQNLKYNGESNKWENGIIQHPNSSISYAPEVKLDDEQNLIVKGYKGLKFISMSRTFTCVKS
jgi:uncharacterized protein (DUF2147 family)